jgi:hypothetical protein
MERDLVPCCRRAEGFCRNVSAMSGEGSRGREGGGERGGGRGGGNEGNVVGHTRDVRHVVCVHARDVRAYRFWAQRVRGCTSM